ncbi:hypothetical protein IPJ91_00785 [bacterium]|nr:MAG: hypothetical protein IPJ91_00785 [bacterium]
MAELSLDTTPVTQEELSEYYEHKALRGAIAATFDGMNKANEENGPRNIQIKVMNIDHLLADSSSNTQYICLPARYLEDIIQDDSNTVAVISNGIDGKSVPVGQFTSLPSWSDFKNGGYYRDTSHFLAQTGTYERHVVVRKDDWAGYLQMQFGYERITDIRQAMRQDWFQSLLGLYGPLFANAQKIAETALALPPIDFEATGQQNALIFPNDLSIFWGNQSIQKVQTEVLKVGTVGNVREIVLISGVSGIATVRSPRYLYRMPKESLLPSAYPGTLGNH